MKSETEDQRRRRLALNRRRRASGQEPLTAEQFTDLVAIAQDFGVPQSDTPYYDSGTSQPDSFGT